MAETLKEQLALAADANRILKRENERLVKENELLRLRAENAALKNGLRIQVARQGGVSVFGLGRFPTTLYRDQWLKLLSCADAIRAFIAANEGRLRRRDG